MIISAGFAELGTEEGRARQARLRAVAREMGVRVCGPNCLGLANVADNVWATAVRKIPVETQALKSNMALVSQSGATCFGPLLTTARDRNVGFRYIISSGNEADLEASDYIQYLLQHKEIEVVAALVEGFKDGAQFVEVADTALKLGKPIVLLKVGRSAVGAKAASSHTAAMTGSDVVQDALFKQKGVVRVDDYDELIETANMFLKAKPPPQFQEGRVPLFYTPGKCAKGIRRLVDYYRTREGILREKASGAGEPPAAPEGALRELRAAVAAAGGQALNEYDSKRIVARFGVSVTPESLCTGVEEAKRVAAEIGYPVAVKIASRQITHKTDAGGVRLGLAGPEELAAAYEEMLVQVKSRYPEATIDGVLVQQMVRDGVEMIIGISRDPQFGPVLMLGLGGILVEALGAATWRVCPIGPRDAREMIDEVRGLSKILAGYRGHARADAEALVDALVKVSRLAVWAADDISSLDINPLAVLPAGRGVAALDALIFPRS